MTGYRLYSELADWWPLISPPGEYIGDAQAIEKAFAAAGVTVRTLLDLGSGGGGVAAHLKDGRSLTLIDISASMLAVSRRLNPQCRHLRGDMRTIRLGRVFDAVLVHDAVDYVTERDDLRLVIETAYAHTRPGGVALFAPDHTAETFRAGTGAGGGGHDGTGRQASFTERTRDPDRGDDWILAEYEFTLRDADGTAGVVAEAHRLGAFGHGTWLTLLAQAGFVPQARPRAYEGNAARTHRVMFVATRP